MQRFIQEFQKLIMYVLGSKAPTSRPIAQRQSLRREASLNSQRKFAVRQTSLSPRGAAAGAQSVQSQQSASVTLPVKLLREQQRQKDNNSQLQQRQITNVALRESQRGAAAEGAQVSSMYGSRPDQVGVTTEKRPDSEHQQEYTGEQQFHQSKQNLPSTGIKQFNQFSLPNLNGQTSCPPDSSKYLIHKQDYSHQQIVATVKGATQVESDPHSSNQRIGYPAMIQQRAQQNSGVGGTQRQIYASSIQRRPRGARTSMQVGLLSEQRWIETQKGHQKMGGDANADTKGVPISSTKKFKDLPVTNFQNADIGRHLIMSPYRAIQNVVVSQQTSSSHGPTMRSKSSGKPTSSASPGHLAARSMDIRYRKDMQQLRFYQTLNSQNQKNLHPHQPDKHEPSQDATFSDRPQSRQQAIQVQTQVVSGNQQSDRVELEQVAEQQVDTKQILTQRREEHIEPDKTLEVNPDVQKKSVLESGREDPRNLMNKSLDQCINQEAKVKGGVNKDVARRESPKEHCDMPQLDLSGSVSQKDQRSNAYQQECYGNEKDLFSERPIYNKGEGAYGMQGSPRGSGEGGGSTIFVGGMANATLAPRNTAEQQRSAGQGEGAEGRCQSAGIQLEPSEEAVATLVSDSIRTPIEMRAYDDQRAHLHSVPFQRQRPQVLFHANAEEAVVLIEDQNSYAEAAGNQSFVVQKASLHLQTQTQQQKARILYSQNFSRPPAETSLIESAGEAAASVATRGITTAEVIGDSRQPAFDGAAYQGVSSQMQENSVTLDQLLPTGIQYHNVRSGFFNRRKTGNSACAHGTASGAGRRTCQRFMEKGNKASINKQKMDITCIPMALQSASPREDFQGTVVNRLQVGKERTPRTAPAGQRPRFKAAQSLNQRPRGVSFQYPLDKQIEGLNLTNLINVHGPAAQQQSQTHQNWKGVNRLTQHRKNQLTYSSQNGPRRMLLPVSLSKLEPEKHLSHLKMLKSMLDDGTIKRYIDGERSRVGAAIQGPGFNQARLSKFGGVNQNAPADQRSESSHSGDSSRKAGQIKTTAILEKGETQQTAGRANATTEEDDSSNYTDADSEDEDPIIIRMLDSMLPKNTQTPHALAQLQQQCQAPEALRDELRQYILKEFSFKERNIHEQRQSDRFQLCEKLFSKIETYIRQKTPADNSQLTQTALSRSKLSSRAADDDHPFFKELRSQMVEREAFFALEEAAGQASQGQLVASNAFWEPVNTQKIGQSHIAVKNQKENLFAHTQLQFDQIDEQIMEGDGTQCIHSMAQSEGKSEVGREDEDIFVFYNLKVDPPAKFFSRLGDEAMVTTDQAQAIQYFIYSMWPVIQIRRNLRWHISLDQERLTYNCVITGMEAPLSRCCKMCINFQFSRLLGGRVTCCMQNGMCAQSTLQTFDIEEQLFQTLFQDNILIDSATAAYNDQQDIHKSEHFGKSQVERATALLSSARSRSNNTESGDRQAQISSKSQKALRRRDPLAHLNKMYISAAQAATAATDSQGTLPEQLQGSFQATSLVQASVGSQCSATSYNYQKYQFRAASHQLSKRVTSGNFKHTSLQQAVVESDQMLQKPQAIQKIYPSAEIANLVYHYTKGGASCSSIDGQPQTISQTQHGEFVLVDPAVSALAASPLTSVRPQQTEQKGTALEAPGPFKREQKTDIKRDDCIREEDDEFEGEKTVPNSKRVSSEHHVSLIDFASAARQKIATEANC